jgi:hypothetical protein
LPHPTFLGKFLKSREFLAWKKETNIVQFTMGIRVCLCGSVCWIHWCSKNTQIQAPLVLVNVCWIHWCSKSTQIQAPLVLVNVCWIHWCSKNNDLHAPVVVVRVYWTQCSSKNNHLQGHSHTSIPLYPW